MISTETCLKVKENISVQKWSTGSSITLKYKLFCTDCKLFLSIEKKVNQLQRQLEKINWFKDHPISELQIDEIGYYGFILTGTGYLLRLPLGIFGIQDAKEEWNQQIANNSEKILTNYKQIWELLPKLKEVVIVNLKDLNLSNVIINPITKKTSLIQDYQLEQFSYLNLWRANDNNQSAIITTSGGVILFLCLATFQINLGLNLEVDEIKQIKLVETQSLSYLIVQHSQQDEYLQINLQKNQRQEDKASQAMHKKNKQNNEQRNILNSYRQQSFLSEMAVVISNAGFKLFISEEEGAIRLFFYSNKTKILKIYRPGSLQSSKYRFFISLSSEIIDIVQWKNYYVIFQRDNLRIQVDFYLKITLMKCDKKIFDTPNFKPTFPKPVFSYNLYDQNTEIYKVDQFIQLSDRTFQTDIFKNNGIDSILLDLNHGKLELENLIHSDNFSIQTYIYYELFLKNHSYDFDFCINHLYESLKSQQKWENLCLIDLQNKNKDPFKLFHEYSNIKSAKMGNLNHF